MTGGPSSTLRRAVKGPLLTLPLLLAAIAGCGSSDAGPSEDDSDIRAVALACLTEDKGVDARLGPDDTILLSGDEGALVLDFEDEVIRGACVARDG